MATLAVAVESALNASAAPSPRPAGFWQRAVAWSIDAALVAPLALLLSWPWWAAPARTWASQVQALLQLAGRSLGEAVMGGSPLPTLTATVLDAPGLREAIATADAATWSLAWPALLAYAALGACYHVAAECSHWQGGLGKGVLGLRVCDRQGQRLAIGRAALRYVAAGLSWATLNLGHLMAALPPRHLALHDRCSGTRVVARDGPLPRWAWAWLAMLTIAGVVATGMLARTAAAVLRTALEQALY